VASADLYLAGVRSVPGISRAQQIPQFLAGEARGAAAFGDGGACAADQARRDQSDRRRIPPALISRFCLLAYLFVRRVPRARLSIGGIDESCGCIARGR